MHKLILSPARLLTLVKWLKIVRVRDAARLALLVYNPGDIIQMRIKTWGRSIAIRPASTDLQVMQKILIDQEYKPPSQLNPVAILDAGAYIGLSALYFHFCFPNAVILALEPDPENFQLLQKNIQNIPEIIPVNAALWSSSVSQNFTANSSEPWASHVSEKSVGGDHLVPCISLSEAAEFTNGRIDFMKIDIEGGEKEAFKSVPAHLLTDLKAAVIEFHERFSPGSSDNFMHAISRLPYHTFTQGENSWFIFGEKSQPALKN